MQILNPKRYENANKFLLGIFIIGVLAGCASQCAMEQPKAAVGNSR